LTTLGKVIYALSSGDKKVGGVFRESKLTRLLQESLTGNTYTFVMANLSPSIKNLEETINTLKFVERANHITLKVKPTELT
jgi:kinesin family protein 4/21/27